jgi:hypothetical protein
MQTLQRLFIILVCSFCGTLMGSAHSEDSSSKAQTAAELVAALCLGSGNETTMSGSVKGEVTANLKEIFKKGIGGTGAVDGKVETKSWEGLIGGLNSSISQLQSDQATAVRECIKPHIDKIVAKALE